MPITIARKIQTVRYLSRQDSRRVIGMLMGKSGRNGVRKSTSRNDARGEQAAAQDRLGQRPDLRGGSRQLAGGGQFVAGLHHHGKHETTNIVPALGVLRRLE